MLRVSRLTKPPKEGPLRTEYEFWFKNRDRLIELFSGLHVGIVGRHVVAVGESSHSVYSQIICKLGNTPMVIERADYSTSPSLGCSIAEEEYQTEIDTMMLALERLAEDVEEGNPPAPSELMPEVRAAKIRKAMFEYTNGATQRRGSPYFLKMVLREESENFRKAPWEVAVTHLFEWWEFCLDQELKSRMEAIPIPDLAEKPRFTPATSIGRLLNRFFPKRRTTWNLNRR